MQTVFTLERNDALSLGYHRGGPTVRNVVPDNYLPESMQGRGLTRNSHCPCGSGKKVKRCCARPASE